MVIIMYLLPGKHHAQYVGQPMLSGLIHIHFPHVTRTRFSQPVTTLKIANTQSPIHIYLQLHNVVYIQKRQLPTLRLKFSVNSTTTPTPIPLRG